MNTYKFIEQNGSIFAFEIENTYIRVSKIAFILNSIPDISNIQIRKPFSDPADIHIRFLYMEKEFIVWEPYADSSRYWIGPQDEQQECIDIAPIEQKFQEYKPTLITQIFGDLITLKFLSILK